MTLITRKTLRMEVTSSSMKLNAVRMMPGQLDSRLLFYREVDRGIYGEFADMWMSTCSCVPIAEGEFCAS